MLLWARRFEHLTYLLFCGFYSCWCEIFLTKEPFQVDFPVFEVAVVGIDGASQQDIPNIAFRPISQVITVSKKSCCFKDKTVLKNWDHSIRLFGLWCVLILDKEKQSIWYFWYKFSFFFLNTNPLPVFSG